MSPILHYSLVLYKGFTFVKVNLLINREVITGSGLIMKVGFCSQWPYNTGSAGVQSYDCVKNIVHIYTEKTTIYM